MARKEKLEIEISVPSKKIHVEHVTCPRGHSLMEPDKKIHGHPSIKMKLTYRGKEGVIYLDPVYGSFDHVEVGIKLPKGAVVEFLCPKCSTSLTVPDESCQLCSSPMFIGYLPKGGIIEGCLKKGCYYHRMKIVDGEEQIGRLFQNDTLESYL